MPVQGRARESNPESTNSAAQATPYVNNFMSIGEADENFSENFGLTTQNTLQTVTMFFSSQQTQ